MSPQPEEDMSTHLTMAVAEARNADLQRAAAVSRLIPRTRRRRRIWRRQRFAVAWLARSAR